MIETCWLARSRYCDTNIGHSSARFGQSSARTPDHSDRRGCSGAAGPAALMLGSGTPSASSSSVSSGWYCEARDMAITYLPESMAGLAYLREVDP